jgi:hypothetical protein
VTAKRKPGPKPVEVVQSAMRLPRALHEEIAQIAARKHLSMSQAVVIAVEEYCQRETANAKPPR